MKVFLSHTSEMAEYPAGRSFVAAAKDAVNEAGFLPDEMRFFPATDKSPGELDAERLMDCDVYVGILGFKYGSIVRDKSDVSYTQDEFRQAHAAGKRLLVFLLDENAEGVPPAAILDAENGPKQIAFRQEVQDLGGKGIVCSKFKNADELNHLVVRALQHLQSGVQTAATGTTRNIDLFDGILAAYSTYQLDDWHACLRGKHDRRDRLDHYVEPHYSLLNEDAHAVLASDRHGHRHADPDAKAIRSDGYEPVAAEGDDAETELSKLLTASSRLCLAEDAGAGKSVFTRRALAFACSQRGRDALFGGKSCLAVRWEQWENDWPTDFARALADAIADDCRALDTPLSPDELVAWALGEGRVLLILDGLDQVASDEVIHGVASFLNGAGRNCRAIVTGRSYKVDHYRQSLFRSSQWRFARIEGFDDEQIAEYLQGYDVDTLFPEREAVADLLRIPSVLRIVRELVEQGDLERFDTRGELYLQASYHLILRAGRMIDADFDDRQTRRIEQILAAVAFEMMTRELYGYAARGVDTVDQVERGASRRCEIGISDREWTLVREITNLTNHCILEGSTQAMLSWQHRGMMEFYCSLHLGRRVVTDQCLEDMKPFANSRDWQWAWRFAIELPDHVADSERRTASLSNLFRPPAEGRRPNELIYRAWNVMERTHAGRDVLAEFQSEYRELLRKGDATATQIADSFRPCPPDLARDSLTFLMGSPDSDGDAFEDEKPQVQVTVEPFVMASTPTMKRQYWLYDPAHEHDSDIEYVPKYSPHDDCPIIGVDWYDAWCFARWCGARLPSEAEWEYACRAGTTTKYSFGDDAKLLGEYEWYSENSGNQTRPVGSKKPNPWGFFDMHGNVWEWCADWYRRYTAEPAADAGGPEQATNRVVRGGCWAVVARSCRSALRYGFVPGIRYDCLGFRLAAVPPSQQDKDQRAEPGT